MDNGHRLHLVKAHASFIESHTKDHLHSASAALTSIGGILIHRECGGHTEINSVDAQGLYSAVETIGLYLELLAEGLEKSAQFMVKKIEEVEGVPVEH